MDSSLFFGGGSEMNLGATDPAAMSGGDCNFDFLFAGLNDTPATGLPATENGLHAAQEGTAAASDGGAEDPFSFLRYDGSDGHPDISAFIHNNAAPAPTHGGNPGEDAGMNELQWLMMDAWSTSEQGPHNGVAPITSDPSAPMAPSTVSQEPPSFPASAPTGMPPPLPIIRGNRLPEPQQPQQPVHVVPQPTTTVAQPTHQHQQPPTLITATTAGTRTEIPQQQPITTVAAPAAPPQPQQQQPQRVPPCAGHDINKLLAQVTDLANAGSGLAGAQPTISDAMFTSQCAHYTSKAEKLREDAVLQSAAMQLRATEMFQALGPHQGLASVLGKEYAGTPAVYLLPLLERLLTDLLDDEEQQCQS